MPNAKTRYWVQGGDCIAMTDNPLASILYLLYVAGRKDLVKELAEMQINMQVHQGKKEMKYQWATTLNTLHEAIQEYEQEKASDGASEFMHEIGYKPDA